MNSVCVTACIEEPNCVAIKVSRNDNNPIPGIAILKYGNMSSSVGIKFLKNDPKLSSILWNVPERKKYWANTITNCLVILLVTTPRIFFLNSCHCVDNLILY